MKICKNCSIEDKISECCGSHPETGETKTLYTRGEKYHACINLDESGLCIDYENRPDSCREHECYKVNETELCDLFDY